MNTKNKFLKGSIFNFYFPFQVFKSPIDILSLNWQWTNKTIKLVILPVCMWLKNTVK